MKKYWEIITDKFGGTILHTQFIMLSYRANALEKIKKYASGKKVIDIGCGRMPYRKILEPTTLKYIGLDDQKVSKLYNSKVKPEILADITKRTQIKNNSFDVAFMLEVLEYLENPQKAFDEIARILDKKGILVFTAPFLYPLHDVPYDRNRYTSTQIKTFLTTSKFKILKLEAKGGFLSFWFQSINVFLFKRIMDILKSKKNFMSYLYLAFLLFITPEVVLLTNSIFMLTKNFSFLSYPNYFPLDYLVVAVKESKN